MLSGRSVVLVLAHSVTGMWGRQAPVLASTTTNENRCSARTGDLVVGPPDRKGLDLGVYCGVVASVLLLRGFGATVVCLHPNILQARNATSATTTTDRVNCIIFRISTLIHTGDSYSDINLKASKKLP